MEAISNLDQADQSIPQDSDVYVNYYGLTDDPFNPEKPLFFSTPHLEKLHRLFNYLARFSRKLVVVTAEPGAGKTALLEHFVQDQNEQDLVCYFAALNSDTPVQVLHEIADQLELDAVDSELPVSDIVQQIQAFSLACLDEGRSCIVVIDDAHLFDASVLEQLYQLTLDDSQARCSIRLLLGGEEILIDRLQEVVPAESVAKTLFHQQISPLSFEETNQYLQVHFRENGGHSKMPFNTSEIERIFQESAGLPGRVNEMTKQVMIEAVNRLVDEKQNGKKPRVFTLLLVPALIAISAIFWWQYAQQGEIETVANGLTGQVERAAAELIDEELDAEDIFAEPEIELEVDAKTKMQETELASETPVDGTVDEATESDVVADSVKEAAAPDQIQIAALAPETQASSEVGQVESQEQIQAKEAKVAGLGESASKLATEEPAPQQIALQSALSSNDSLLKQHAQKILAFDRSSYTMQLLGSRNEDSILATMRKLPGDTSLMYFEKTHKGAPWYVLIYGNYPNRASADAAAANLPAALNKFKPWVRGVVGIQKEVVLPAE